MPPLQETLARKKSAPATPSSRDALLDAAERVILRDGIGSLTLEAAAREAGVSKSGLLHHVKGKDALIDALVSRTCSGCEEDLEAAIAREEPGPGRVARAFLRACLTGAGSWSETVRRSGKVLVAALVHDPRRVEPLRRHHRDLAARVAGDGLPPGVGEAVKLAVDGLWFDWLFGFTELTNARVSAIRDALQRLVETAPAAKARGRGTRPRSPGVTGATRTARTRTRGDRTS